VNFLEKVSIIVPVFNAQNRLEACINSLLNQTYNNTEIIIVDDGSADSSPNIIDKLYKQNPNLIKTCKQNNSGVAAARNKGLALATGDYVMFVDSDDNLDNCCIEKVLSCAIKHNSDITRFKFTYLYADGTEKIEKSSFPDNLFIEKKDFKKYIYNKIITGMEMNSTMRTLFKKQVVNNVSFNEHMVTGEDLVFIIDTLSNARNFLYLPYPLYYYYQSNQGLTGSGIDVFTKYKYNIILSFIILQHLKMWGMYSPFNILKTVLRLLFITFSKLKRRLLKSV
jgi:glycosyltransferase involved in cell wall biosynthesis